MRYENYKLEDCYFMNHGDEWTEEEMDEVLSTFPETKDNEEKIAAVEQLLQDIEDGVLKTNRYNEVNASSARAYANRNKKWFIYHSETSRYYAGIYLVGSNECFRTKWSVTDRLKRFHDNEQMMASLVSDYRRKEEYAKREREEKAYEELHAERIDQGKRTKEKMYDIELRVCTGLEKATWRDYYIANTKRLVGSFYISYNRYGEITTAKDELLTVEAGRELEKACDELAKEISEIIDVYNGKFTDIIRKGKEKE